MSPTPQSAEDRIRAALAERGPGKTICPSEIARGLAGDTGEWRSHMGEVHRAVDVLLSGGAVTLSWKGERMSQRRGPYRIGSV